MEKKTKNPAWIWVWQKQHHHEGIRWILENLRLLDKFHQVHVPLSNAAVLVTQTQQLSPLPPRWPWSVQYGISGEVLQGGEIQRGKNYFICSVDLGLRLHYHNIVFPATGKHFPKASRWWRSSKIKSSKVQRYSEPQGSDSIFLCPLSCTCFLKARMKKRGGELPGLSKIRLHLKAK